jgi:integrase
MRYISAETTTRVLSQCPDAQMHVMIAFARYGGLRFPSEILPLKWEDIDWENRKVLIHSPKTAHIPGQETRLIPLLPQLERALLTQAARLEVHSDQDAAYIITRYRNPAQNVRTPFMKLIQRAALKAWPHLCHNLRASQIDDLSRPYLLN